MRRVPEPSITMDQAKNFHGIIECENPNEKIYDFQGRMTSVSPTASLQNNTTQYIPLSASNLILQGCHIRNTSWIYGVAVYTGNQTKLGQNKSPTQVKRTKQDLFISRISGAVFCLQLILTIAFGIVGNIWQINYGPGHWYLDYKAPSTFIDYLVVPLRFLLLNSLMIPISLKVTLDFVKYFYAQLIQWDIKLYDHETDQNAVATSTKVCEDLGQIQVICCDKTGTLTQNSMSFSKCVIGETFFSLPHVQEYEDALETELIKGNDTVINFLMAMAVCNTVKVEKE